MWCVIRKFASTDLFAPLSVFCLVLLSEGRVYQAVGVPGGWASTDLFAPLSVFCLVLLSEGRVYQAVASLNRGRALQLPLQGASMETKRIRGTCDVAIVILHRSIDIIPLHLFS